MRIQFILTSDTHAQWQDHPNHPGYSLLNTASLIRKLRQDHFGPTIQIDLGDFIQGSSMATYTGKVKEDGNVYSRVMNQLDYHYQIIGNHEFNFGRRYQDSALDGLNAKILCSNIVQQDTDLPFKGAAYDILDFNGQKIGIIGVTTHYIPHWELPAHYQGLQFKDAFETVKEYVHRLRDQVDLLVVAYHGGFERDLVTGVPTEELTGENQGYQMLEEISGIDLLLTGHQHRIICETYKQTLCLQPGYGGEMVGQALVEMEAGKILSIQGALHSFEEHEANHLIKDVLEPEYSDSLEWLSEILGYASIISPTQSEAEARIEGHPFIEYINYLIKKEMKADFAGSSLLNHHFAEFQGEVTRETLLKIYPFYNLIAKVKVSGEALYSIMEHNMAYFDLDSGGEIIVNPSYLSPKPKHYNYDLYTGFTTEVDLSRTVGNRVLTIIDERTQRPIDRDKDYTLAVTQYRAVGGGDYRDFSSDKIIQMSQEDIATLIQKGLKELKQKEWDYINHHYQHVVWRHPLQ